MSDNRLRAYLNRILDIEEDLKMSCFAKNHSALRDELHMLRSRLHGGHIR